MEYDSMEIGSLLEYLLKSPFFTPIQPRFQPTWEKSWKTFSSGSLANNSKFTSHGAQMPLDLKSDSKRSLAELSRKSLDLKTLFLVGEHYYESLRLKLGFGFGEEGRAYKYGEESSSYPEVEENFSLDVAPHSKMGRIHGLGQGLQLSNESPNLASSACSACSTTSSTTAPIIPQSQIDEAVSRAMATMWSTQMAPMLQSFMSQVNQAPTRSSQGEERQSNPANDDNDDADLGA
ncbi:uncharacterized protein G2W53_010138 [Senna tora]|uniref:Uncharacterized protein n=1 Tax=Senna tora TaxID=362788 RepID=A0A834WZN1_9FABA|nr:uncharacterized protein G2W53_010138 [Senna tora]